MRRTEARHETTNEHESDVDIWQDGLEFSFLPVSSNDKEKVGRQAEIVQDNSHAQLDHESL